VMPTSLQALARFVEKNKGTWCLNE